jgi:hypothetical protein
MNTCTPDSRSMTPSPFPASVPSDISYKRELIEALMSAWLLAPSLRFGQLLVSATDKLGDMYYIPDGDVAAAAAVFAAKVSP